MEAYSEKSGRVFFALWPHDEERAALAQWQTPLQGCCGGRPTPAQNLHNTLVFLGDVAVERMEALQLAAQEVRGSRFRLVLGVAHYWGHNHIVYAAPAGVPEQLTMLVQNLQNSLQRHHFEFDRRSYKPHVTLLRHARWSDTALPEMRPVVWGIEEFVLVQSHSAGAGVAYEVLAKFILTS